MAGHRNDILGDRQRIDGANGELCFKQDTGVGQVNKFQVEFDLAVNLDESQSR